MERTLQLAAAALIADTFVPRTGDLPAASELGVPEIMLDLAGKNPRAAERRQLDLLLKRWDSRAVGAVTGGRPRRFSALSDAERERLLLKLASSRVPQKRALFSALRFGLMAAAYSAPGPTGHSPRWDDVGYAAPFGVRPDAPQRPLSPVRFEQDTELTADVVIVGSGAGGGTAAGVLAAAPQSSVEGQIALMAGHGVGGGTVVNYTTSFRTPDDVRAEWAALGAAQFAEQEYADSLDAVCTRLGVNTDHDRAGRRDQLLEQGLEKLGWHGDAMPRNVIGCEQDVECGRCGLGCRIGAKQSTAKTWLVDAEAAGARIVVGARAMRVLTAQGRASGVEAVTASGHRLTVSSRAVVVAGGALQTPALLRRSGLSNPNIGRYLRLHPATAVWGRYEEEVLPWTGPPQARFSREHRDLDGLGHGVIYETAPITAAFGAAFLPWHGAEAHANRMRQLRHLAPIAVITRDRDGGEVKVGRDGEPVVRYRLSSYDAAHLHRGHVGAAQIADAAGAVEIFSTHQTPVGYEPGRRGSVAEFAAGAAAVGYGPGRMGLAALHIMGSARMGGSAATSATNPDGETWEVPGLVVADGSCFPTASGVNPMISIEAISHMNARRLAARLG